MAFDPNTQERVYQALKLEYLAGHYAPGARLDIQRIADRFRASATPVREALHRLIGEQLVESHPDGGIRVVMPSPGGLADLYAWNAQHLLAAVRLASPTALSDNLKPVRTAAARGAIDIVSGAAALFRFIGDATANSEFVSQIDRANARLHYVRIAEQQSLPDLERELRTFLRNGKIDVRSNLRRRIIAYHRRRIDHLDQISRAFLDLRTGG
ncbi:GntR family transcriptional regulator [Sphingomonas sp. MMS12-HWE2-04]|uniref:GntR family transcriptional regulator n=1 Tax=Sphingomonas sp. MMS12-HWE2-04 TaxID=3234199 RepID=UPI00385018CB